MNIAVLHLDWITFHEFSSAVSTPARLQIELPFVEGTLDLKIFDIASIQRPSSMRTLIFQRVNISFGLKKSYRFFVDVYTPPTIFRNVVDSTDLDVLDGADFNEWERQIKPVA